MPETRERFLLAGVEPVGSSPEQFAATINSDAAAMAKVITAGGLRSK
jgi:tripartite-type tricarboxylate transporter receptor subunit TctC